ncbi:MAG: hypothetical protein ATN34_01470 [Epulopiscium sp. Nele67-Bin002]|nr:MAG: hypothetical protein ATN34_01470 [Epulopiscium sp. Nele67-Bin002]OON92675.1 MAG: hypothetical protein ATN33_06835 [Epulopiscium sp. Nele67-Bin001]
MRNLLVGMILGVANVIPGVSAGTMAVVFKIYDRLLDSISLDIEKLKENFSFLATLGVGVILGVLLFSNAITYLYENFNMQTNYAFMGVILGSIPMIYGKITDAGKIETSAVVPFTIPLLIMLYMALQGEGGENSFVITELSLWAATMLIIAGMISAFTMIIPGISGSFILLTIGCYTTIITAISDFNIMLLMPFGIGVVIGLVGGSKLVRILLERYTQATYLVILGLVVGSVFTIFPGFTLNFSGIVSVIALVIGAVVSYAFSQE